MSNTTTASAPPLLRSSAPAPTRSSAPAWNDICALDDITPNTGVAAMIDGVQIAVVRVGLDQLFAVGNFDPFSKAHVIARGIVGDAKGVPKIASPIYKQCFDLRNGRCLDDPAVSLPTYPVRSVSGRVQVTVPS